MESLKNSDVRVNNRKRVVDTIFREGSVTKQDLAARLDISLATVTFLLKELTENGLITKGEVLGSTGGRKPVCVAPVYEARYAVGMEISMHELRIVLVDLGANVVAKEAVLLDISYTKEYWIKVNGILNEFISRNVEDVWKLLEVGIALQISMQDGAAIIKREVAKDSRIDLAMAAASFERPVRFQNSAKLAAIAQIWSLNDWDNFTFLSLGTYVGGAIVYNSAIVDFFGRNSEFGSIVVENGKMRKKIADYCTTKALCEKAGVLKPEEIFAGIAEGNEKYRELWEEYLDILSVFLHNLYSIFGWKIVIGGSMSPYLEEYRSEIEKRFKDLTDYDEQPVSYFKISDLGKFGAAVGAALHPIDEFLEFGYYKL